MPIYEYHCPTCRKQISIWFRSVAQADTQTAACTDCGSTDLTRLISRVAVAHSAAGGATVDSGSPGESPQALAQAMRAAGAGRDMGRDFQEVAQRLEKGESAGSVEASLRKRVGEDMQAH